MGRMSLTGAIRRYRSRPNRALAASVEATVEAAVEKAKGRYSFNRHGLFMVPLIAVEVWADLTPVIRMGGLRRLPGSFGAGVVGAEVATWGAISPSLLPHSWWVVAANVAICQGAGHLAGTAVSEVGRGLRRVLPLPNHPRITHTANTALHLGLSAVTVGTFVMSRRRHIRQIEMVGGGEEFKLARSFTGITVGTLGYGALLAVGEALQVLTDLFNVFFGKRLPPLTSWPLAVASAGAFFLVFTDQVVLRNALSRVYRNAEELDRQFMLGAPRPAEPERSGSPASFEPWDTMGRQGRAVAAGGPRKRDIDLLLEGDIPAKEPIRIFIGLHKDRSTEEMVEQAMAELDRPFKR